MALHRWIFVSPVVIFVGSSVLAKVEAPKLFPHTVDRMLIDSHSTPSASSGSVIDTLIR
jgi:hypothetical protein